MTVGELPKDFAVRVVRWQKRHGRSGLPWQSIRDPYRVWLSEIMLQQTQVATVLGYYARFLERFPDVASLAAASQDDVMALWSGLGYYSRARNLHRCAQAVVQEHGGAFPSSADQLQQLPGIGRSTAAAIASFCFGERVAILDANVARVLSRVLAFEEDLARSASQRALWNLATDLLPATGRERDMPAYTQGLMDLGATLCAPKQARCADCPLQECCAASQAGNAADYPVKRRSLKRQTVALWLLLAERSDGALWLCKRPQSGIWAGLYCLPVFESAQALAESLNAPARKQLIELPVVQHALTHRELYLHPMQVGFPANAKLGRELQAEGAWFSMEDALSLGLPAPVRKLLANRCAET
jgi:A/G-specific adenine glycosylase